MEKMFQGFNLDFSLNSTGSLNTLTVIPPFASLGSSDGMTLTKMNGATSFVTELGELLAAAVGDSAAS